MKNTKYLTACALAALAMASCTVNQTMPPTASDVPAEQPAADTKSAQTAKKLSNEESEDKEKPEIDNRRRGNHVCSSDNLSCRLGLCPYALRIKSGKKSRKQRITPTPIVSEVREPEPQPAPQPEKKAEEKIEDTPVVPLTDEAEVKEQPREEKKPEEKKQEELISPTRNQMTAAIQMLQARGKELAKKQQQKRQKTSPKKQKTTSAPAPRKQSATKLTEPEYVTPEPVQLRPDNTSGIPGRSGLRMGHFAPPEEAVSRGDSAAPQPNAVERHGLRSPLLPSTLPMNIEGKTNR